MKHILYGTGQFCMTAYKVPLWIEGVIIGKIFVLIYLAFLNILSKLSY
jgi:hypothetical protein